MTAGLESVIIAQKEDMAICVKNHAALTVKSVTKPVVTVLSVRRKISMEFCVKRNVTIVVKKGAVLKDNVLKAVKMVGMVTCVKLKCWTVKNVKTRRATLQGTV